MRALLSISQTRNCYGQTLFEERVTQNGFPLKDAQNLLRNHSSVLLLVVTLFAFLEMEGRSPDNRIGSDRSN